MGYIHNPIRRGFYPDPSVCFDGQNYYCIHSSFAYMPGIPIFKSPDLITWEQVGNALTAANMPDLGRVKASEGIYAPTIRFHDGMYYIITTLVPKGTFYITAKYPEGPWSAPVWLEDAPGIDPSLYFEGDDCWYVGTKAKDNAAYDGDGEIWLQKLDLDAGKLTGERYILWDGFSKRTWWPEGPHIYKVDGWYILLIAEDGTEYNHCIAAARSRELTGPYESCPYNPIFTHRHLGKESAYQNVGHGDLVRAVGGDWYILMLGTRPLRGCAMTGRETFLAQVQWEDGWPIINPGEGKLRQWQKVGNNDVDSTRAMSRDVDWQKIIDQRLITLRAPLSPSRYETMEGQILLNTSTDGLDSDGYPSFLGVRLQEKEVCFSVRVEVASLKPGDSAGVTLFYDERNHIRLEVLSEERSYQIRLLRIENGFMTSFSSIAYSHWKALKKETTHDFVLSVMVHDGMGEFKVLPDHAKNTELRTVGTSDVTYLSAEISGGFTGAVMGIYSLAGKEKGGSAVFDTMQVRYMYEN